MDYLTLEAQRRNHPAWRLLVADSAPLVASFLQSTFLDRNLRTISQQDLAAKLEDYLFHLRERLGDDVYPRPALDYLDEWAGPSRGWLRKYYPSGSDDPHFDLTPATEKALTWLAGLGQRQFVGTDHAGDFPRQSAQPGGRAGGGAPSPGQSAEPADRIGCGAAAPQRAARGAAAGAGLAALAAIQHTRAYVGHPCGPVRGVAPGL